MSKVFVIVGPSGAGKDTLLSAVLPLEGVHVAQRVITRPADAGGEAHEAATPADFRARQAAGEFAVAWEAHGLEYAVPKCAFEQGAKAVVFNGSRAAMPAILQAMPEAVVVEITASAAVLAKRLAARGRESAEQIEARLARSCPLSLPIGTRHVTIENNADLALAAAHLHEVLTTE